MKYTIFGVLVFSILLGAFPKASLAADGVIPLCKAMEDEETYKKKKKTSLQYLISGKDGWILRTKMDLKDDFELSDWSKMSFARLVKAFKYNGTDLAVIMIPTRGLVGYDKLVPPYSEDYNQDKALEGFHKMIADMKASGLIMADMTGVDQQKDYFLVRDNHWTAEGAKFSAQRLAESIKQNPVYASLTKKTFTTTSSQPEEVQKANDRFIEFIEEVCGGDIKREIIPAIYNTTASDEDLLGDAAKPEVVLLGTSNSTQPEPSYANFIGFLKEYTSVDIANHSIPGGAFSGAISNYVLTGRYQEAKPKLIVWELGGHYGLDQDETFREIIPSLYGECQGESVMAESSGTLHKGVTKLFENLGPKALSTYAYYLYLELENKEMRKFKLSYHHAQGRVTDMKTDRKKKEVENNNGIFYSELHNEIGEALDKVFLESDEASGGYKAKICKAPIEY